MASGETQLPSLPEGLMAEIEKIARDQNRSVGEAVSYTHLDVYKRQRDRSGRVAVVLVHFGRLERVPPL